MINSDELYTYTDLVLSAQRESHLLWATKERFDVEEYSGFRIYGTDSHIPWIFITYDN